MPASSPGESTDRSTILRMAPAFLEKSAHTAYICSMDLLEAGLDDGTSCNEDDICRYRFARLVPPKHFAEPALGSVPPHRASQAPAGHHSQTKGALVLEQVIADEEPAGNTPSSRVDCVKIRLPSQPFEAAESLGGVFGKVSCFHPANRRRPLRRRRAMTARPALLRMRIRNPCAFLRRLRFGWNVLFILSYLSCLHGIRIRPAQRLRTRT